MTETHISKLGKCAKCDELVRVKQVIEDREVIENVELGIDGEKHDCQQLAMKLEN